MRACVRACVRVCVLVNSNIYSYQYCLKRSYVVIGESGREHYYKFSCSTVLAVGPSATDVSCAESDQHAGLHITFRVNT